MDYNRIKNKLEILADAAKYDVSCASSGSKRKNQGGLGNGSSMGICHSYSEDGRCISLLKVLLTNHCIYDCAYCVTRRSNDIPRAAFKVQELVDLTLQFYRRNYIEGLFLSSGIFKNPDATMERLVAVARKLREAGFYGYIHLKSIPGASDGLMQAAGTYADRLSVNIEVPTREGLKLLAPEKNRKDFLQPMKVIQNGIRDHRNLPVKYRSKELFAPAGQSTQMIVGATGESDLEVMATARYFYEKYEMKRVYYSGYVPISSDRRMQSAVTQVPMQRENRLYQADWLLRYYGFTVGELLNPKYPNLDLQVDPKLGWALRNMHLFPVDINRAEPELLLRVPGIGRKSVYKILRARKHSTLCADTLNKMGVSLNRARYFLVFKNSTIRNIDLCPDKIRSRIQEHYTGKYIQSTSQLSLF